MKSLLRVATGGGSLFLLAFLGTAPAQDFADDDPLPDGIEIRTRGPVHEAFAQPNDIKPVPGQAIPKEPPAPIPEEPPEERPEGDNVQFIPGYWAWDMEQNQFLWVSGGYRNAPVGRQWVPGHWVHTDEGWRWVPGMWAAEQQDELRYTPQPPEPLQVEPSLPPESEDSTWVPGNWVYRESRFAWRPGYYSAFRPGRVWVASRYAWTPNGYLYNDGYWDYPLEDRGLCFAPVYFHRPFWHTAGWRWRPSHVLSFGLIYDSCFTHYGFSHLYFGNYYGARHHGFGYRPWFDGYGRHHSTFAHHRWHNHRHDRDWYGRQRDNYRERHDGRQSGPPRTWAEQRALVNNKTVVNNTNVNQVRVVAPLSQAKNVNKNVNLVKLTAPQAETQRAAARRTQEIAQARSKQAVVAKVGGVQGTAPRKTEAFKLPPLVRGTETVRPKTGTLSDLPRNVEFSSKKKSDANASRNGSDNDRKGPGGATFAKPKGINPPAVNNAPKNNQNPGNKPRVIDNTPAFKPKADSAKPPVINKPRNVDPSPPRIQQNQPQPKINNVPKNNNAPKVKSSTNFAPRINNASPAVPKAKAAPPKVNYSSPAPRNNSAPKFSNPAPKVNYSSPAPRNNAAPKFNNPAPKVNYSSPAPRNFSAPKSNFSAPRAAPQSAPRSFSPAPRSSPAPRASSAPAGRSAPARSNSAPRSGGGGKSKGGRNE